MAPAGAKTLSGVPIRLDYASKSEWLRALRQTVQCFSKAQKSEDSLKEEETYVVWVNTWLELSGHGTFVQGQGGHSLFGWRSPWYWNLCLITDSVLYRAIPGRTRYTQHTHIIIGITHYIELYVNT